LKLVADTPAPRRPRIWGALALIVGSQFLEVQLIEAGVSPTLVWTLVPASVIGIAFAWSRSRRTNANGPQPKPGAEPGVTVPPDQSGGRSD
jgi:hypothetical protein